MTDSDKENGLTPLEKGMNYLSTTKFSMSLNSYDYEIIESVINVSLFEQKKQIREWIIKNFDLEYHSEGKDYLKEFDKIVRD